MKTIVPVLSPGPCRISKRLKNNRPSNSRRANVGKTVSRGFTLIELMVAVAVAAILASIALPSYSAYVQRSRVPPALLELTAFQVRMEMSFQDNRTYANAAGTACAATPTPVANFSVTCALSGGGSGYTADAAGTGPMAGYTYRIDSQGTRTTVALPSPMKGPTASCWSIRGGTCDS